MDKLELAENKFKKKSKNKSKCYISRDHMVNQLIHNILLSLNNEFGNKDAR